MGSPGVQGDPSASGGEVHPCPTEVSVVDLCTAAICIGSKDVGVPSELEGGPGGAGGEGVDREGSPGVGCQEQPEGLGGEAGILIHGEEGGAGDFTKPV